MTATMFVPLAKNAEINSSCDDKFPRVLKSHGRLRRHILSERRPQSCVKFDENLFVVNGASIDDDEICNRWYSKGEYFFIKKEALSTVRRISFSRTVEETDRVSARGLEIVDIDKIRERRETIAGAVQKVLSEQERKGSDPDKLAPVSRKCSKPSVRKSIQTAAVDAKDARCYLADASHSPSSQTTKFKANKVFKKMFSRKSSKEQSR